MGDYRVTVLEFAYGENVPISFYIGDFADPEETVPVHPFSMTLLQGNGKNILIDCGMDFDDPVKAEICRNAGIGHTHTPKEVLATVGLAPEDISDIILTHAHFDHAGAVDCYPNAMFYLQKREFLGWSEYAAEESLSALGAFSMDPADIKRLKKLHEDGRLTLVDGDKSELLPGISVLAAGFGHTFGMQMVVVETQGTILLHVGDVANRPENLLGNKQFPFYLPNTKFAVGSPYYMIADYERIMKLAVCNLNKVIMTHDGTRREKYEGSIGPLGLGIYRIC